MLEKVKALPHKIIFALGLTLILAGSMLSFNIWSILIGGIFMGVGLLFIVITSNKKFSDADK